MLGLFLRWVSPGTSRLETPLRRRCPSMVGLFVVMLSLDFSGGMSTKVGFVDSWLLRMLSHFPAGGIFATVGFVEIGGRTAIVCEFGCSPEEEP